MNKEDKDMRQAPSESVASEADRWLARLHAPDCGPDDRSRFQDWLAEHPMHWQAYNQAERHWAAAAAQTQDPEMLALVDKVLMRAQQRRQTAPRRRRLLAWVAAVALVAGVVAIMMRSGWLTPEPPAMTYSTAIGEIRTFTLPDDSVITLNTDTLLQVRMGKRARSVALQRGEAQFNVAPDRQRPFIVGTPQADVTAIGTVFQVRNVGETTDVSLLEGHVQVTPATAEKGQAQREDLAPGDRLLAKAGMPWQRIQVDSEAASGWLSGRLVFDAIPLQQAVEEFNRYSPRKLRIDDPAIADIPIEGVFNAGDTDSIVLALQYAYPLRVEEQRGEFSLRHR